MKPDREDCLLLGLGSIALAVLLCLLLRPCNAQAQTSTPDSELQVLGSSSGERLVVPVQQGARVPFDGFLFSRAAAVRAGVLLERHQLELDEQVRHLTELRRIDVERLESQLQLERSSSDQRELILNSALASTRQLLREANQALVTAADTPWYETWGFGFGVGVTVSAVLVGLAAWLVASTI